VPVNRKNLLCDLAVKTVAIEEWFASRYHRLKYGAISDSLCRWGVDFATISNGFLEQSICLGAM
jgi:hypothetical protein